MGTCTVCSCRGCAQDILTCNTCFVPKLAWMERSTLSTYLDRHKCILVHGQDTFVGVLTWSTLERIQHILHPCCIHNRINPCWCICWSWLSWCNLGRIKGICRCLRPGSVWVYMSCIWARMAGRKFHNLRKSIFGIHQSNRWQFIFGKQTELCTKCKYRQRSCSPKWQLYIWKLSQRSIHPCSQYTFHKCFWQHRKDHMVNKDHPCWLRNFKHILSILFRWFRHNFKLNRILQCSTWRTKCIQHICRSQRT